MEFTFLYRKQVNHITEREGSRTPLCFGLERRMYLKRKIRNSSQMIKMAEIFFREVFRNALAKKLIECFKISRVVFLNGQLYSIKMYFEGVNRGLVKSITCRRWNSLLQFRYTMLANP